jgi:hypothetical protein
MIRAYIKNQASCPRVLHNRLWRFPFKPQLCWGLLALPLSLRLRRSELKAVLRGCPRRSFAFSWQAIK